MTALAQLVTTELRQAPANLTPWLQLLLSVHARVTSLGWLERHDSPCGTVHHFPDGPVMRVRTARLLTVPERTAP